MRRSTCIFEIDRFIWFIHESTKKDCWNCCREKRIKKPYDKKGRLSSYKYPLKLSRFRKSFTRIVRFFPINRFFGHQASLIEQDELQKNPPIYRLRRTSKIDKSYVCRTNGRCAIDEFQMVYQDVATVR